MQWRKGLPSGTRVVVACFGGRVGDTVTNYVYRRDAQLTKTSTSRARSRRVTVGPAKNAKKKKEAG